MTITLIIMIVVLYLLGAHSFFVHSMEVRDKSDAKLWHVGLVTVLWPLISLLIVLVILWDWFRRTHIGD